MKQQLLALLVVFAACSQHSEARDTREISARIVDFGIYYTSVDETVDAPGTTSGELSLLYSPRLVRSTTTVPALAKSSFGLRYVLDGLPEGEPLQVTDVIVTPGIRHPESDGPLSYRESRADVVTGGKTVFTGYTFDQAWEAVPGEWRIEVWHADELLLSKSFTVVKSRRLLN